jgi:hypothetical protein
MPIPNDDQDLKEFMAAPHMRRAHLLWHGVRERWLAMSPQQQGRLLPFIGSPPRPSMDRWRRLVINQGAGVDFLYAHRTMIREANGFLAKRGRGVLVGWEAPPLADDRRFPAVRNPRLPERTYIGKNDAVWSDYVAGARAYSDHDWLRRRSLDEIGTLIEYGIHAAMHQRFADVSSTLGLRDGFFDLFSAPSSKWDVLEYDTLLDFYAAHVNPAFWYIHLWIDGVITAWEQANGRAADWTGAWLGPMDHHHHQILSGTIDPSVLEGFPVEALVVPIRPRIGPNFLPI